MFSSGPRRFGSTDNPWFRIGNFDVGTSAIAAGLIIFGMLIWAAEGPSHAASFELAFTPDDVLRGKIWQFVTWFVPPFPRPSVWTVISAAILVMFGAPIEQTLGRVRMAWFLVALLAGSAFLGLIVHLIPGIDGTIVLAGEGYFGIALLISFVLFLPGLKFLFGIPGWVVAAVIVFVQYVTVLGDRSTAQLLWFTLALGGWMLTAKAFGLANEIDWIPSLPFNLAGGPSAPRASRPSRSSRRRRSKGPDLSIVNDAGPGPDRFAELEIDQILDQISAFGMDSLSKEQRRKLEEFSNKKKRGGK